jgi:hypothetical protein
MKVIIGIDPHKASDAAWAIDDNEADVAQLRIRAGRGRVVEPLRWAQPYEHRVWAIESAGGLGYLLAQQLVAAGECVVDVPATLSSRVWLLGSGLSQKNDPTSMGAVPSDPDASRRPHCTAARRSVVCIDLAGPRQPGCPARAVLRDDRPSWLLPRRLGNRQLPSPAVVLRRS